jgi:putative intracellular protease/amidase
MKIIIMLVAGLLIGGSSLIHAAADKPAHVYVCPACGCNADDRTFDKPGKCPDCHMDLVEKSEAKKDIRPTVAVLLFDNAEVIDYAGPWEVFGEADYKVFTVAEKSAPINAVFGQKIVSDYTFANSPAADIILVPGGGVHDAVHNPELIRWVQRNAEKSKQVMSVCTGAFILSKAGLLDGLSATTIAHALDDLQKASPKTKVVHDQRYVDNGKIITTAGLSSGIDGAFHVVAKVSGGGEAQAIALGMEYRWDPHSTYARAALADRYLPDWSAMKELKGKVISTQGDVDSWEMKARVSEPSSIDGIADLLSNQITSGTPHGKGPVNLTISSTDKSALDWKFTDEDGREWAGEAKTEPSPGHQGEFVVTLRLARAVQNKST